MVKIIRFALIGVGAMGKKYADLFTNGNGIEGLKLTAVVIRSDSTLEWFKKNIKAEVNIYRSNEELFLHENDFDAVLVASPHKTHFKIVKKALELGKFALCEKPLSTYLTEGLEMVSLADKYNKKLGVMFQCRTYPVIRKFKELLDSGQIGDIKRVISENSLYYRTYAYHRSADWRSTWKGEGGGAIINQGQHILDTFIWLFGKPLSVYADIKLGKYTDISVEDEVTMTLDYGNGVSGVFILTTGEIPIKEEMSAIGSKGKITMEGNTLTVIKYKDSVDYGKTAGVNSRENIETETVVIDCPPPEDTYKEVLENFRDYIIDGRNLIAEGKDGLNVIELTAGAYISSFKKTPITLPPEGAEWESIEAELINKEESKHNG